MAKVKGKEAEVGLSADDAAMAPAAANGYAPSPNGADGFEAGEGEVAPQLRKIENAYDENSLSRLEGLEAVRHRPAMYIGDTGLNGMHHLFKEIIDNSIDEVLAGYRAQSAFDRSCRRA